MYVEVYTQFYNGNVYLLSVCKMFDNFGRGGGGGGVNSVKSVNFPFCLW